MCHGTLLRDGRRAGLAGRGRTLHALPLANALQPASGRAPGRAPDLEACHPSHTLLSVPAPAAARLSPATHAPRCRAATAERAAAERAAGGAGGSGGSGGQHKSLYTLAQLQAASRDAAAQLRHTAAQLQQELEQMADRIPLLVRAIWGKQSVAVVDALKQQRQLAARLIRQWEAAEHRLIAVANSLSVSSSGQVRVCGKGGVCKLVVRGGGGDGGASQWHRAKWGQASELLSQRCTLLAALPPALTSFPSPLAWVPCCRRSCWPWASPWRPASCCAPARPQHTPTTRPWPSTRSRWPRWSSPSGR